MKIRSSIASKLLLIVVLAFFYLFAPSFAIRYFSLLIVGTIVISYFYSRVLPSFVTVFLAQRIIRGIKLQEMQVELPATPVVNVTLQTVPAPGSPSLHNLTVWGEPTLHRAEQIPPYAPPKPE